jgi:hypothetical protein
MNIVILVCTVPVTALILFTVLVAKDLLTLKEK